MNIIYILYVIIYYAIYFKLVQSTIYFKLVQSTIIYYIRSSSIVIYCYRLSSILYPCWGILHFSKSSCSSIIIYISSSIDRYHLHLLESLSHCLPFGNLRLCITLLLKTAQLYIIYTSFIVEIYLSKMVMFHRLSIPVC